LLEHKYQAHNSECNVEDRCHELKMYNKEILCTEAMPFTITQSFLNISAVADVKGGSASTR